MKKTVFFIVIISILLVPSVFAQFRLDMGIKIPVKMGINFSDASGISSTSVNILDKYTFLLPEASGSYQFALGPIKVGAGLQMYSLILESIVWPMVFAELDLSPIVINAKIGGLGYLLFGLYNDAGTGDLLMPEINVAFKLGKSFRLGGGVMFFTSKDFNNTAQPYLLYLGGSFSTTFK